MSIVPLSGCSCPVMMRNSVDLPAPFGPDDADDPARRQGEGQILEQQLVAERLGDVLRLDHLRAEPLGHLDHDLRLARLAVGLRVLQLFELPEARLGLGLPALGGLADPFQLLGQRALAAALLALLLRQALGLLVEIGRVIALVGKIAAAIELENPFDDVCRGSSGHG